MHRSGDALVNLSTNASNTYAVAADLPLPLATSCGALVAESSNAKVTSPANAGVFGVAAGSVDKAWTGKGVSVHNGNNLHAGSGLRWQRTIF